ncbi:MAG: Mut7-C RNAse domain-containing protein [Promethearchaeota archaeon]
MVDAMFGKCGKFLRLLGFDTEIANSKWSDTELLEKVLKSHRILITRDAQLYHRCIAKAFSDDEGDMPSGIYCQVENVVDFLVCVFQKLNISANKFFWDIPDDHQKFDSSSSNSSNFSNSSISLDTQKLPFMPRCSVCNAVVYSIPTQEAIKHVPEGTARFFQQYWRCSNPKCGKIYWIGQHWNDILQILRKVDSLLKNAS